MKTVLHTLPLNLSTIARSMAKSGTTTKELQEKFWITERYAESFVAQAKFEKARNEELQARYDAHDARMSELGRLRSV